MLCHGRRPECEEVDQGPRDAPEKGLRGLQWSRVPTYAAFDARPKLTHKSERRGPFRVSPALSASFDSLVMVTTDARGQGIVGCAPGGSAGQWGVVLHWHILPGLPRRTDVTLPWSSGSEGLGHCRGFMLFHGLACNMTKGLSGPICNEWRCGLSGLARGWATVCGSGKLGQ